MKLDQKFCIKFNKIGLILILLIKIFDFIHCDPSPPKFNKYKTDKSVKHSLFREKDSIDRMSQSSQGVPMKERLE